MTLAEERGQCGEARSEAEHIFAVRRWTLLDISKIAEPRMA
jgi:hypothetical protein